MIVVTGTGRSGTSLIARLYREVGLDPGGTWNAGIAGGLEDPDVVRVNQAIMRALGLTSPMTHLRVARDGDPSSLEAVLRRFVPQSIRRARRDALRSLRIPRFHPRWDRWEEVVETYGEEIRSLSERVLVKDPRFCWTIGVWADAGASLDYVLLCVRDIDVVAAHFREVMALPARSHNALKSAYAFGLGFCVAELHKRRVDYRIVGFPEFLDDPDLLFEAMKLRGRVPRPEFDAAVARVVRKDLVHP